MRNCPSCNNPGRKIKRVTLESLLRPQRRADIGDGQYNVCLTPGCRTVYFGAGDAPTFVKSDLSVRFGLKETDAPRPICYCFDHSVEEIHDEIRRTGRSTVLDSIKAAMKGPGCRCEYTNPLGGCCLSTVQDVVTQGFRLLGRENGSARCGVGDRAECCAGTGTGRASMTSSSRSGAVAAGGSLLAAILSSACCWLPVLLITFGVSAAGISGFLAAYRPYFIAGAVVLLGFGFYTLYVRREKCAADSPCAPRSRRLRAFSRIILWTATVLVGAFVLFPKYVGYLLAAPKPGNVSATNMGLGKAKFRIEGMTCEGCAEILRAALAKIPNVKSVDVDYPARTATVRFDPHSPVAAEQVIEAVKGAGYTASSAAGEAAQD